MTQDMVETITQGVIVIVFLIAMVIMVIKG